MIDIIQEIENLKSYAASNASHSFLLPTNPPQHPWGAGTSVEQMIKRLDSLKEKIIADQKENQEDNISEMIPSTVVPSCKNLITYIKSYVESNGPCTERFIQGLYEFIDKIDTQMVNLSSENAALRTENETLANRNKLIMRIHDILEHN